jgi:hypothetical protein
MIARMAEKMEPSASPSAPPIGSAAKHAKLLMGYQDRGNKTGNVSAGPFLEIAHSAPVGSLFIEIISIGMVRTMRTHLK